MCGIVGIVHLNSGGHPALDNIAVMADTLTHRGPDGQSCYRSPSGRCALGHTRLKVIDLETGDQPMPNEDGSVQVVFNGEIYNFRALRRELEGRGHHFSTQSDTEVLVHGYEEWGTELPGRLEGMFAFAVWSETTGELFLARDRAGQKPLFVYEKHGLVIFASEIKAILAAPKVDDTLDPAAVPLYLTYGYVPTPGSFYRSIRKVAPGTTMRVGRDGEIQEERYWRLDFTPPYHLHWRGCSTCAGAHSPSRRATSDLGRTSGCFSERRRRFDDRRRADESDDGGAGPDLLHRVRR